MRRDEGGVAGEDKDGAGEGTEHGLGHGHGMPGAELFLLLDKGDAAVREGVTNLPRLVSDDDDDLFRLQLFQAELYGVAQHHFSQQGMEDLDQV